jgi:hypothetical protein
MERLRRIELDPVDIAAAFAVVLSVVMMLQLSVGRFDPSWATFVTVLACAGIGFLVVRRVVRIGTRRAVIGAILFGVLALALRWNPFLYTEGAQDQGIYVAMSSHYARAGTAEIKDAVRGKLAEPEKAAYDKLNNGHLLFVPKRYEGIRHPGVYISEFARSAYVFQFYPLHPLWMSAASNWFGEDNRVYSLVLLSMLGVLMLSLIAYEVSGRILAAGWIAAALLILNPIHVFLSRFPVSENVTVCFTATALYFLLRYVKSPPEVAERWFYLAVSALAWTAAFFTHIGGFLYTPLFALFLTYAVVTAPGPRQMRQVVVYGLAILAGYGLSLWYGFTWSFPYSFDIYRARLGAERGAFFVAHWRAILFVTALGFVAYCFAAWRLRAAVIAAWHSLRLNRALAYALLAVIVAVVGYALYDAYRVGYTSHYAKDPWLAGRWGYSGSGVTGFMHSSLIALAAYVSPFILLFVFAMLFAMRRRLDAYHFFLLAAVALFMVLRSGIDSTTTYYYYGRYLAGELVPFVTILAASFLSTLLTSARTRARALAAGVLVLSLLWQATAVSQQYQGGMMHRLHASMKPVAAQVRDHDVLLLAGGEYFAMRTGLEYYYGRKVVVVDRASLRTAMRQYARHWNDVYVLSDLDSLIEAPYVGAFTFVQDEYLRGGPWDILPFGVATTERRFYLYRYDRTDFGVIREGDVLNFASGGNSVSYLGGGWSGQEQHMRWTMGDSASMHLPMKDVTAPLPLRFFLLAHACVPVTVRVNGQIRERWSFSECDRYVERAVQIMPEDVRPGSSGRGAGAVTLTFDFPEAKSPSEVNPASGDSRKLGISVQKMTVGGLDSNVLREGDVISFESGGNSEVYLGKGWSGQESYMRWTEGDTASLRLPMRQLTKPLELRFVVRAHECVPVTVRVNGKVRGRWSFSPCEEYVERVVQLTPEDVRAVSGGNPMGTVAVSFDFHGAKSPAEVNPAAVDRRRLGISVQKVTIARPGA